MKNINLVNIARNLVLLVLKKTSYLLCVRSVFAVLLFIILHLSFNIQHCEAQWVKIWGGIGYSSYIHSLAANGNTIFAGLGNYQDNSGVYRSTDYGNNWTCMGLDSFVVYSLAVSGNNIFAGTVNSVWLSTNDGENWSQTSLNTYYVKVLCAYNSKIYAGTFGNGVYYSSNSGNTWVQTSLNNKKVYSLAIKGDTIYAGSEDTCVYVSTNNGITWTQTQLYNNCIFSLAIKDNIIFAGGDIYSYKSTNNGNTWTQTFHHRDNLQVLCVSGNNIFAGLYYWNNHQNDVGVWLSKNDGANWIKKNEGITGNLPKILSMVISDDYIFFGTNSSGLWRRSLSEIIGIKNISTEIPSVFSLEQNYPNPFNAVTSIKFSVPMDSRLRKNDKVVLKVFDLVGREVAMLVNERLSPGTYEVRFESGDLPSGIYFYRIESEKFSDTKNLILLK